MGLRIPKYILDADIEKCFDKIDHSSLLRKIDSPAIIKKQVKAWLDAKIIEKEMEIDNTSGTPQGGIISPLLCNIALNGLEKEVIRNHLKSKNRNFTRVNKGDLLFCRYADDFVVAHENLEKVEETKKVIQNRLSKIGLTLSEEKTRIVHSIKEHHGQRPGINFLGFRI